MGSWWYRREGVGREGNYLPTTPHKKSFFLATCWFIFFTKNEAQIYCKKKKRGNTKQEDEYQIVLNIHTDTLVWYTKSCIREKSCRQQRKQHGGSGAPWYRAPHTTEPPHTGRQPTYSNTDIYKMQWEMDQDKRTQWGWRVHETKGEIRTEISCNAC